MGLNWHPYSSNGPYGYDTRDPSLPITVYPTANVAFGTRILRRLLLQLNSVNAALSDMRLLFHSIRSVLSPSSANITFFQYLRSFFFPFPITHCCSVSVFSVLALANTPEADPIDSSFPL